MDPMTIDPTVTAPSTTPPDAPQDFYALTDENKDKILAKVRERMGQWSTGAREATCRNAWRNLLFKRGHQWLVYDRGRGWWRPIDAKKYTGPRPVTNRFASTMNAFTSTLARIEPTISIRPATDEPEDRAAAEVGDRVLEIVAGEVNERFQRQILANWVGYTGGAWIESGYDPSAEHGMRLVQHATCPMCQTTGPPTEDTLCATCGGPTTPAVDAQNEPVGEEVPIGAMYEDVVSLFEMYFDPTETDWRRVPEYIRKTSIPKSRAEVRWGAIAKDLPSDLGSTTGAGYQEQLATLAGYQPDVGPGAGTGPVRTGMAGRISETAYWALPSEEYPEGVCAIILGGSTVVHLGALPYRDGDKPFLPTVYFAIDPVPGSMYSKTPADDLALKQMQRNQLEAHILMTMNRMAWPIWIVPEGSNVSQFGGEPGQILRYNALGPNAAKPERMQGTGLPNGAITWLQYIDSDFEELTAAYAGTKGDRQQGVSAGIALQMIEDRKNQRFGPMYILWEHAWAEVKRHQLAIFRQFVTEPRLLKIQGRGGQWRVAKFLGADLADRMDVVAEAGSGAPRSSLVKRAEMEQLNALGVISSQDPEVKAEWLKTFGYSNFVPSMKADSETAAKQIEFFLSLAQQPQAVQALQFVMQQAQEWTAVTGQPVMYSQAVGVLAQQGLTVPKVRPQVDGHAILARELGTWLKGDESQALPQPIQDLVELKHAEHMQLLQMAQMAEMQARAGQYPTSGYLSNPGGQQGATQQQQNSTSPNRQGGEMREMEQAAQ